MPRLLARHLRVHPPYGSASRIGVQLTGAFTRTALRPDGTFTADVLGLPGARYPVDASSDLERWQPAGDILFNGTEGPNEFIAPTSAAGAQYFRLKSPNP